MKSSNERKVVEDELYVGVSSVYLRNDVDRICDLCDSGIIQDEKHVIFECADPILTNIRTLYSSIINQASNSENPVSHLMNSEYDHQTPHMIHDIMKRIENQFFSSD